MITTDYTAGTLAKRSRLSEFYKAMKSKGKRFSLKVTLLQLPPNLLLTRHRVYVFLVLLIKFYTTRPSLTPQI